MEQSETAMTPSNLLILLAISILLGVPPAAAAADELATPAELAELASREQRLRSQFVDRLSASVIAVTEYESQALSARMTERLQRGRLRAARPDDSDDSPPPARRVFTDEPATTRVQAGGNTTCTRVGSTLACVLRDIASR